MNTYNISNTYQDFVYNSREIFSVMLNLMDRQEETLTRMLQQGGLLSNSSLANGPVDIASVSFVIDNMGNIDGLGDVGETTGATTNNGLTQTQIADNTTRLQFSEIQNPVYSRCPITREDFNPDDEVMQINGCGHIFTPASLESWFARHNDCPYCRYVVSDTGPSVGSINRGTGGTGGTEGTGGTGDSLTNALISQFSNLLNVTNGNSLNGGASGASGSGIRPRRNSGASAINRNRGYTILDSSGSISTTRR